MVETADPFVFIEEQRPGYVVYYRSTDGARWSVSGTCDRRGDCLVGSVIDGFGLIESKADIGRAQRKLSKQRIDSELDVPVTPGFDTCCGRDRFEYAWLPYAEPGRS